MSKIVCYCGLEKSILCIIHPLQIPIDVLLGPGPGCWRWAGQGPGHRRSQGEGPELGGGGQTRSVDGLVTRRVTGRASKGQRCDRDAKIGRECEAAGGQTPEREGGQGLARDEGRRVEGLEAECRRDGTDVRAYQGYHHASTVRSQSRAAWKRRKSVCPEWRNGGIHRHRWAIVHHWGHRLARRAVHVWMMMQASAGEKPSKEGGTPVSRLGRGGSTVYTRGGAGTPRPRKEELLLAAAHMAAVVSATCMDWGMAVLSLLYHTFLLLYTGHDM